MLLKSLVRKILEAPTEYDWSIQGLGMLRLYLDDTHRMHIWDDRYQVEDVSQMHTHPWNFQSTIIAGVIHNHRFVESSQAHEYHRQKIFCGVGGGLVGEPDTVKLAMTQEEIYTEGNFYTELAHEIHISKPERGTVTIVERQFLDDADHAYVYWDKGEWISAEPRKAELSEILDICNNSLYNWFDD